MKNIGTLLLLVGIASVAFNFIGLEHKYLVWVDAWGETTGWLIRGAVVVVGGILVFLGMRSEASEGSVEQPATPPQMPDEIVHCEKLGRC